MGLEPNTLYSSWISGAFDGLSCPFMMSRLKTLGVSENVYRGWKRPSHMTHTADCEGGSELFQGVPAGVYTGTTVVDTDHG